MSGTPKTLTVTECHQLLAELGPKENSSRGFTKSIRNYTMALLMLDAGLRVGEVVALKLSDLYFGHEPVENLTIAAEIAKNKSERTVPLASRLRMALTELYKKTQASTCGPSTTYAFRIWPNNRPLTTRQVERIIRKAAIRSIGRPIHPHMLRHTFATRLMRKTNARIVMELLGHSQMSSTQIYMNPNSDDLRKAIDQVNDELLDETTDKVHASLSHSPADRRDAARADHDHR